jgi:PAS domain S-box-containing protein
MKDKERKRLTAAEIIHERSARRDRLDSALDMIVEAYLASDKFSAQNLSAKVLKAAKDFTGSSYGFVAYIDNLTGWMIAPTLDKSVWKGHRPPVQPFVFKKFSGLWGWVLTHKKPLLTNSAASDPRSGGTPPGHIKIAKFLAAPAIFNGGLAGIIALANPKYDYTADDLAVIARLARIYAVLLQRERSESRIKESESRNSAIIAASQDMIYTADMHGRITFISQKVTAYGYSPEEIIGRHISEFVHPDDRHNVTMALGKIVKTGAEGEHISMRLKKKDGSYIQTEEKSGVIKKEGLPIMLAGIIRDVTDREKMRERLIKNEETLRRIFETATDAIFVKDLKGRYLQANKACSQILRMPAERILGKTDFQIFPKKIAESIRTTDRQVIRTGNTIFTNENILGPGRRRAMYASKTPLRDANGAIMGVLGIAKDITELKRLEEELIRVKALEAVNKVASPAAHDLNNVLAAINGYTLLIMENLRADSPIRTEITQILNAVIRASAITDRLQTYGAGTAKKNHLLIRKMKGR